MHSHVKWVNDSDFVHLLGFKSGKVVRSCSIYQIHVNKWSSLDSVNPTHCYPCREDKKEVNMKIINYVK